MRGTDGSNGRSASDAAGRILRQNFCGRKCPIPRSSTRMSIRNAIAWEFARPRQRLSRGLPIFAICKGMQLFNVALGGTLQLDIPGHDAPEMSDHDVQPLRTDRTADASA